MESELRAIADAAVYEAKSTGRSGTHTVESYLPLDRESKRYPNVKSHWS